MLNYYILPPEIRDHRLSVLPPFDAVNPFKAIVEAGTQKLFTQTQTTTPLLQMTDIPPVTAELDDVIALNALRKKSA